MMDILKLFLVLTLSVVQLKCYRGERPLTVRALQRQVKPVLPDAQLVESIFGEPAPVSNVTSTEVDYWDDVEDFQPSKLEYDSFDFAFAKIIGSGTTDNAVVSPLGMKLPLAILSEAATDTTNSEISLALGLSSDRKATRTKFTEIINSLKVHSDKFILNLGSRIYISNVTAPRQKFQTIASTYYDTNITTADFQHPSEATKDINSWVSQATEGRISALVSEGDLENAVMILLNTIFFKGAWRHPFQPNNTRTQNFYLTNDRYITHPFMSVTNRFYCAESMVYDAKIVRLPYLGNKFALYLIVPNSINGLTKLFNDFNYSKLKNELFFLKERLIQVVMPKFKFDFSAHVNSVLFSMGIRQAFQDTASFPGLASLQNLKDRLKISEVLQKTGIEVNELGSVAFAATEIVLVNKFGEDDDNFNDVIVNHPFMFFIEDETTRQLLFIGKVTNPAQPTGTYTGAPVPTVTPPISAPTVQPAPAKKP